MRIDTGGESGHRLDRTGFFVEQDVSLSLVEPFDLWPPPGIGERFALGTSQQEPG